MSVIGVVLKEGYIEDNRKIFYLHEDIRRFIQGIGYDIEIIIPSNNTSFEYYSKFVSGVIIQDKNSLIIGELNKYSIPYMCIDNINDLNNSNFFHNLIDKSNGYYKLDKVLGVTCRYFDIDNIGPVLYLSDKIRKTFVSCGCVINLIIPVQDICYPLTSGKDFPRFSDIELKKINNQLDNVNGLVFPGGYKFTPFDRYILDYAYSKDIATLGICLGMQLISCFKKNIEIVPIETGVNHKQENDLEFIHYVNIDKDSILYKIIGNERIKVNSFHRMMATNNPNIDIIARSDDDVIEGVVVPNKKFILGVQWHPEISYNIDEYSKRLIDYFVNLL